MQYYKRSNYPSNSEQPFHKVTHRHDKSIPGCTMLPDNERYRGVFPSADVCAFVNGMKQKMKFFDDGERLQYNAPSRIVEVEPSEVVHPIAYPPKGFVLEDGQWVYDATKA